MYHVSANQITLGCLAGILIYLISCQQPHKDDEKPNVLLIFTDQQNVSMMSAAGNPCLRTPSMDKLAQKGVMFMQSYCTSPVCGPARSSIISGRMPHETGDEWNGDSMRESVKNVGEIFREAGYKTVWGGKWHLPESYPQRAKSRQKEIRGFDLLPFRDPDIENWMLGSETDPPLTAAVVKFLEEYNEDRPFFLAVSYHNPHDICFYARKDGWVTKEDSLLDIRYYGFEYNLPEVIGTNPSVYQDLPELPENHRIDPKEPEFIHDKRIGHNEYGLETKLANAEFGELDWKGYYHAYCKLTEMVDHEIGQVLHTISQKGQYDNTIIVFTSDHGDGAAAHKWAAKLSLYEESAKVPLIISWENHTPQGVIDRQHLVSQIDIIPTLCDFAGIAPNIEFTGKSLRNIMNNPAAEWRDYLVVELADYKPDTTRKGRMLRTPSFKYNVYSQGKNNEQFFDLRNDPGEMNNLIGDSAIIPEINRHRAMLREWIIQTGDTYHSLPAK